MHFLAARAEIVQQSAQILNIDEAHVLVGGDAKRDVQNAFLNFVEFQQPRHQQRPHVGNRRADRMALLAKHIPEHRWESLVLISLKPNFLRALDEKILRLANSRNAGEVALDVGGKDGHARS